MNACTRAAYTTLGRGLSEQAARGDAYEAAVKIDGMPHLKAIFEASRVVLDAPTLPEIADLLSADEIHRDFCGC